MEYNCFTMLCSFLLYNKVNQLYVYIYPHIPSLLRLPPTLPIPPLWVVTKHRADLPVLCSCFPLAIYFTFGSVYMSVLLSHFVPAYPSPSLVAVFKNMFTTTLRRCRNASGVPSLSFPATRLLFILYEGNLLRFCLRARFCWLTKFKNCSFRRKISMMISILKFKMILKLL